METDLRIYFEEACPFNQVEDEEDAKHWVSNHFGKDFERSILNGFLGVKMIGADRSSTFQSSVKTLTEMSALIKELKSTVLNACFVLGDNPIYMVYWPLEYCESKDEALLLSQIAYEFLSQWAKDNFVISMVNVLDEVESLELEEASYAHPSNSDFAIITEQNKIAQTIDFSFRKRSE